MQAKIDLKTLVNQIPTAMRKFISGENSKDFIIVERPATDHDIYIGHNLFGTFATINMLNPNSPFSPGYAPAGIKGLQRMEGDRSKLAHIILMVQFIVNLLKHGVDAVAIQEIPCQSDPFYPLFIENLKSYSAESGIELDFDILSRTYNQTHKTESTPEKNQLHGFATGFLAKQNVFTLEKASVILYGRGSEYNLTNISTGASFTLTNLHGDYKRQDQTANYIKSALEVKNMMVVGDTNIAINHSAMNTLKCMKGLVAQPIINDPCTDEANMTVDCFVTLVETTILCNEHCKNLANPPVKKMDVSPNFFRESLKNANQEQEKRDESPSIILG